MISLLCIHIRLLVYYTRLLIHYIRLLVHYTSIWDTFALYKINKNKKNSM